MAKKSLLDTLQPKPSAADLDRIAEQIHSGQTVAAAPAPQVQAAPPPPTQKVAAPVAVEKGSKKNTQPSPALPAAQTDDASAQHRLTIDLPKWLVEQIRTDGKKNGQTVRGVILAHLLEKYKNG